MKYYSLRVASHIANVCKAHKIPYNNTKIQKLLYCCYGCVLAVYNKRLCDEYPRAWQYGPVFPRVFSYINKGKDILSICPRLDAPADVLDLIENAIKTFGAYSASALSAWTHTEGSPWDFIINVVNDRNGIIPDDLIAEYFNDNVVTISDNG
jgi:uncharacterized phage-associated protein